MALLAKHPTPSLSFALGEAFQFDWSTEGLMVGGIYYNKVQLSHMKADRNAQSPHWFGLFAVWRVVGSLDQRIPRPAPLPTDRE